MLTAHLESSLSNLDWAIARLRGMLPASGKEAARPAPLMKAKLAWEDAICARLGQAVSSACRLQRTQRAQRAQRALRELP